MKRSERVSTRPAVLGQTEEKLGTRAVKGEEGSGSGSHLILSPELMLKYRALQATCVPREGISNTPQKLSTTRNYQSLLACAQPKENRISAGANLTPTAAGGLCAPPFLHVCRVMGSVADHPPAVIRGEETGHPLTQHLPESLAHSGRNLSFLPHNARQATVKHSLRGICTFHPTPPRDLAASRTPPEQR